MAPTSPRSSTSGGAQRAPLMRRQSSQSSQTSKGVQSPGSAGEHQPLRHAVKPTRHAKLVLPRNHSSARNLAKLARQAQQGQHAAEEGRRPARPKPHEGDTEIRLPGSLDESKPPPMKRNLTAYQLPRNTSHTKLKKNLSHGQLARLGSGKNLAALNGSTSKGPPSPGLKGHTKRAKSEELDTATKDLHEQEVELGQRLQQKKEGPKKVGFAVGSSGDDEEEDEAPQMEGSGMQEEEWTDQSASASPYSTRQNTANNSRRTSVIMEKPPDKPTSPLATREQDIDYVDHAQEGVTKDPKAGTEVDGASEDDDGVSDEESTLSPRSMPQLKKSSKESLAQPAQQTQAPESKAPPRSPLPAAKDHPNPATKHLMNRKAQNTAPALVSNVSALDDVRSARSSPAPSIRSSRSNIGDGAVEQDQDELVSRFIPSASHPSSGSGGNTTTNTPKTGSFHTPENESTLAGQRRDKTPTSPGSTISGSSGAATPAMARSRTELKLATDKVLAEREDRAAHKLPVPGYVFDRRNESLKSYLNLDRLGRSLSSTSGMTSMGPEMFQGRFRAVNTELKVVQRFRDPIAESLRRLQKCESAKFAQLRGQKSSPQKQSSAAAKMPISRSTASLAKQPSKLSTSTSPPKSASPVKPAMSSAKSATQLSGTTAVGGSSSSRRGKVTFSQTPPETRDVERSENDSSADAIARQLWEGNM